MKELSLHKNYSLLRHNTFAMDVKADFFVEYSSVDQLSEVSRLIQKGELPSIYFSIGAGSNILFTGDFKGVILHSAIDCFDILSEDESSVRVRVGAGWNWDAFVERCVANGWWGVENLSYIPGEVGSSAVQNIGAYGVEVKDVIETVELFDFEKGTLSQLSKDECCYGYRESIFKRSEYKKYIVTAVIFQLNKKGVPNFSYKQLGDLFQGKTSVELSEIRESIIGIRRSKLPEPSEIGSAGSFFKNPIVPISKFEELHRNYPSIPHYPVEGNEFCIKVSAGWLIEQCGWKGYSKGQAGVYHKQALVLVNYGAAHPSDLLSLAKSIISSVEEKFGIELSPEVIIL